MIVWDLPGYWLILLNALAWFMIQVGIGYLTHRMSDRLLNRLTPLLRTRQWEKDGSIYQRMFQVKKWKSRMPSGGTVFAGGFSLKHVASKDKAYLERWVFESYRAELTHWMAMLPLLLFFLWNPPIGWIINLVYALAVNLPCIVVQRYNRPRLSAILERQCAHIEPQMNAV